VAVTVPALSDLLAGARRRALHLEMRDVYAGSAAFDAWVRGDVFDRGPGDNRWRALIAPLIGHRVDVRRARIVSEPVTDYIRFEYEVTPQANLAAGEVVRWLPRSRASDLALPGNDFWLVDEQVLFNHFSGAGDWIGVELATRPAVVTLCETAFEAVWQRGIDHNDYQPA
jgi:hypothetical protein